MDIEEVLKETLTEILKKMNLEYDSIDVAEEEKDIYTVTVKAANQSLLIGYHGENILALQHLLKILAWKKCNQQEFTVMLDIDDYRKRQEENALNLAKRKVDFARRTGKPQLLPPMPPFLRRKIHMYCMGSGFEDIETLSEGDGENRHILIKLKQ